MTKYLLPLLLFLASPFAYADYPLQQIRTEYSTLSNGPWQATQNIACQQAVLTSDEVYYSGGSLKYDAVRGYCVGVSVQGGAYSSSDRFRSIVSRQTSPCPYGGVSNGTVCVGGDGPPPPPPPSCPTNIKAVYKWEMPSATHPNVQPAPINGTDGVCAIKITGVRDCFARADGTRVCYYDTVTTGGAAQVTSARPAPDTSGSGTAKESEAAAAADATNKRENVPPFSSEGGLCPAGTVQGGTDSSGIPICMGTGTAPPMPVPKPTVTTAPTVSKTNADGSVTTTTTTSVKNADGSTTTTVDTTTTATDGTKTTGQTAQTSSNTAGDPGKATPAVPPPPDFCATNPQLSVCQNSSVTGTCGAITCTGDAIQCSTLRAAAMMQCQQAKDIADAAASPLNTLGIAASGGADPLNGTFPSAANATVVQASTLNADGWLGGGACFADKSFTVQGRTFVVPLSKTCDYLIALRYGLMALAGLVSFRMLSGAILT